ncbi:FUSC family protein [Shewanella sp. VB17]|nr:FUSC family protein [Shewanella sp. VB17]
MSAKFTFASKVALALALAYLIPMAMGWPQASTAATTVMLIASTGGRRESLAVGTYRVIGTVIGAVIGLLLVGLLIQERLLYMFSVSVVVSLVFYLRNAYQRDPTVFMLTGVMILMVSNGGDAQGAFLYGIDRAFATCFGVVVYTLVSVFMFPQRLERNLIDLSQALSAKQRSLFELMLSQHHGHATPIGRDARQQMTDELFAAQSALEQRFQLLSYECSDVSGCLKEWQLALDYYKKNTQLLIYSIDNHKTDAVDFSRYFNGYQQSIDAVTQKFTLSDNAWMDKSLKIDEQALELQLNDESINELAHLQRAEIFSFAYLLNQMNINLSRLGIIISCIDSVTGSVPFKEVSLQRQDRFLWWDAENAKTAIKVFVIYWVSGLIWIYFNPPGGYSFVIFSVIFTAILSFLPVHPKLLLLLFSFTFFFAMPAYVFILPNLTHWLALGVFLFLYTFIAFYLFKGPVIIFFLMGLFVLGIDNQMNYNFAILLNIMMLFYMVVFMIVLTHYFPFNCRAEHLFLVMKERYFRHVTKGMTQYQLGADSYLNRVKLSWHISAMNATLPKLLLWMNKLDKDYFSGISPEALKGFGHACQSLTDHFNLFIRADIQLTHNPLVHLVRQDYQENTLLKMTLALANQNNKDLFRPDFEDYGQNYQQWERLLIQFFNHVDIAEYSQREIATFYIFLNLHRNIFDAINQCKSAYDKVDWHALRQKRF